MKLSRIKFRSSVQLHSTSAEHTNLSADDCLEIRSDGIAVTVTTAAGDTVVPMSNVAWLWVTGAPRTTNEKPTTKETIRLAREPAGPAGKASKPGR